MSTTVASNPLGSESVTKLMLKFSIPSIISMLVGALYNIVDQLFIGQAVGMLGNAATNVRNWRCCLFQFENGSW